MERQSRGLHSIPASLPDTRRHRKYRVPQTKRKEQSADWEGKAWAEDRWPAFLSLRARIRREGTRLQSSIRIDRVPRRHRQILRQLIQREPPHIFRLVRLAIVRFPLDNPRPIRQRHPMLIL